MITKIKTSKKTMEIFRSIENGIQLQPFILAKLALAMSLKEERDWTDDDFKTDNLGIELNKMCIRDRYMREKMTDMPPIRLEEFYEEYFEKFRDETFFES